MKGHIMFKLSITPTVETVIEVCTLADKAKASASKARDKGASLTNMVAHEVARYVLAHGEDVYKANIAPLFSTKKDEKGPLAGQRQTANKGVIVARDILEHGFVAVELVLDGDKEAGKVKVALTAQAFRNEGMQYPVGHTVIAVDAGDEPRFAMSMARDQCPSIKKNKEDEKAKEADAKAIEYALASEGVDDTAAALRGMTIDQLVETRRRGQELLAQAAYDKRVDDALNVIAEMKSRLDGEALTRVSDAVNEAIGFVHVEEEKELRNGTNG